MRKIYPTDANFILVEVTNADTIYKNLVRQGIIVRNRTNVTMCNGCLRITVGKPDENDALLEALKNVKIYEMKRALFIDRRNACDRAAGGLSVGQPGEVSVLSEGVP